MAYTPQQIYQSLVSQGIPGNDARTLTAISGAESGFGSNVVSKPNRNGSVDYGVFQVNSRAWPQLSPQNLPGASLDDNAAAAAEVYRKQGLTAWSTYNSGAYQQYLSAVDPTLPDVPSQAANPPTTPDATHVTNPNSYQPPSLVDGIPDQSGAVGDPSAGVAEPGFAPGIYGGPFSLGITQGLQNWGTGIVKNIETNVGAAFKTFGGYLLGTVQNLAVRLGLIIVGILLLGLALWTMIPKETRTTIVRTAAKAA